MPMQQTITQLMKDDVLLLLRWLHAIQHNTAYDGFRVGDVKPYFKGVRYTVYTGLERLVQSGLLEKSPVPWRPNSTAYLYKLTARAEQMVNLHWGDVDIGF